MPIALVDCNSFYCSCETIFRPDLEKRPVIVLSNNDGCVVSRNALAKKVAINMAEPFYKIKNLIEQNNVAYFSSNYPLYADISSRVMKILSTFTPDMEVYSIDEAFLNLDGFNHLSLNSYGHAIKEKVYKDVHIPVSVGIASTKVLAKIANHIAKKSPKANGVVDLSSRKFHDIALSMTKVEDIWGIGRSSAAKLSAIGIRTAKDFRDYKNDKQIIKLLTKVGMQIKNELNEIPCIPIEDFAEKKKQIIPQADFYSYEAKYIDENGAILSAPAQNISPDIVKKLQETAKVAFKAVGCEGMARIDFFLEENGNIILNEINTIPGFTKISMYPRLMDLTGIPYKELINRLVELAIERHNRDNELLTTMMD